MRLQHKMREMKMIKELKERSTELLSGNFLLFETRSISANLPLATWVFLLGVYLIV